MQRLSTRKWVSMILELALDVPPDSLTTFLQSDRATASDFRTEVNMGPEIFKEAYQYMNGHDYEQNSRAKEALDVFHAGTPGALSLEDLAQNVDLGQWRLKLGQRLVKLEV